MPSRNAQDYAHVQQPTGPMPVGQSLKDALDQQLASLNTRLDYAKLHNEPTDQIYRDIESAKEFFSNPTGQGNYMTLAGHFGVSAPTGTILTTAQKQAQNPLYNPLYDPGSAEYKANLVNASNPNYKAPIAPPSNLAPNPNAPSPGPSVKPPVINTQPLQNAYANQNSVVPQYTPPTAGPTQIPTQSGSQYKAPQIQMPQMFQQNYSMGGPSARPPSGIQMPNFSSPLQGSGSGTNWSDLLSVAHNRYQR